MRIYKNKYYIMREYPGLSGFKQWGNPQYYITTGWKAQNNRTKVVKQYKPIGTGTYKLADGHIPECQPTKAEQDALHWLDSNPYQYITPVSGF